VKIIEVDAERRRLSLSLKRIEDGEQTQPLPEGAEPLRPAIDLSEEVFAEAPDAVVEADEILTKDDVEEPAAEEPARRRSPKPRSPSRRRSPRTRSRLRSSPRPRSQLRRRSPRPTDETAPAPTDQPS
jgi:hypothetical protein